MKVHSRVKAKHFEKRNIVQLTTNFLRLNFPRTSEYPQSTWPIETDSKKRKKRKKRLKLSRFEKKKNLQKTTARVFIYTRAITRASACHVKIPRGTIDPRLARTSVDWIEPKRAIKTPPVESALDSVREKTAGAKKLTRGRNEGKEKRRAASARWHARIRRGRLLSSGGASRRDYPLRRETITPWASA